MRRTGLANRVQIYSKGKIKFENNCENSERKTARPVFGVLPYYRHIRIDPEDSVAVQADKRPVRGPRPDRLNVAVVHLPSISNFTDMEALEGEPDVLLNYLSSPSALSQYDLVVIPGAKNTVKRPVWASCLWRPPWPGTRCCAGWKVSI